MNKNRRPILFLDIDDVISTNYELTGYVALELLKSKESLEKIFCLNAVDNLKTLHDNFCLQYVISSSWTDYVKLEEFKAIFEQSGLDFVSRNLHKNWTTPKKEGWSRAGEIQGWLNKFNKSGKPFIVLDDPWSGYKLKNSEISHRVVFCENYDGFTNKYLDIAMQILNTEN